jgi:hypothetical protein
MMTVIYEMCKCVNVQMTQGQTPWVFLGIF